MKTVRKILWAILWLCLSGIIIYSGYNLEMKLNEYRVALDISTTTSMEARKGRDVNFAKLKKQNGDVKGWIWLKDTNIDYPIVQGEDNDYYLHRDLDGNYLYDGCIFIDAMVKNPFHDFNTVIYGHRMRSGAMFHDLSKYSDKEFFDKHPTIIIETEDQSYDLHVIAFCTEMSDSELYTISFVDEYRPSPSFDDYTAYDETDDEEWADDDEDDEYDDMYVQQMTKADFVKLVRETAVNLSDEDFGTDDTFVTLSTCAYSSGDNRNQVIGVLKEAPLEEKTVTVKTKKPFMNRWLAAQILVGIVMVLAVVLPVLPKKKKTK